MPANARCRVLAVDLDGTLISNTEDPARPVSDANLAALKALRVAGTRVVIITGRNEGSARSLLARCADPELAASDLILHNGALLVAGDNGATLRELRLPRAEARRYLAIYRAHGLTPLLFTDRARGGACLVEGEPSPENSRLARYLAVRRREGEGEQRAVADLTADMDEDPLAMATIDSPARIAPAQVAMAALALPGSRVAVQGLIGRGGHEPAQFLEVFHRDAAKDKAFTAWCALRGIPLAATAAIGDGRNDLELLKVVGLGIAMGNGSAELRAAADHVAPRHDQDGLAVAIRAHLLG